MVEDEDAATQNDGERRSSYRVANYSSSLETGRIRQDAPIDDYANLRGPSLLKKTLGLQQNRHSRFLGSTSEYEQLLLELWEDEEKADIAIGASALRRVNTVNTSFLLLPDAATQNHREDVIDLDAIETVIAPHGQALIHLYFRIVHPSFPILHKKVFIEKYSRTHREFSPPLLAAVYLIALNWWSYSSELAILPKPDVTRLDRLALKTMANVIHRPKLSAIQAGLLLLQRPAGDSWALTSQLVGLGQDLGLHVDCSGWCIPTWERGLRKRLAWALFMQDKWGALVHGRPTHINLTDWDVRPLEIDDFPETHTDDDDEDGSTEVEKGRTLFLEMIKLTEILAFVLSEFYTSQAERTLKQRADEGVRWILETAKPLQLALRQWFSGLPAVIKMENITARKLSSSGYLHLAYYAVEMTLHRRILRSLSSADDTELRSICRQAAQLRLKSAMDFVSNLRPEHLQSFWYSASKYNFALVGTFISLLWATSTSKAEADRYKKCLEEYRWVLRLSSKSADFLEQAISMLAMSTGVLMKAIPAHPDADQILSLYQPRGGHSSSAIQSVNATEVPTTNYHSESELHDEMSPENAIDRTPSDSGLVAKGWSIDQTWFDNLGDIGGGFGVQNDESSSNTFLGLDHGEINDD